MNIPFPLGEIMYLVSKKPDGKYIVQEAKVRSITLIDSTNIYYEGEKLSINSNEHGMKLFFRKDNAHKRCDKLNLNSVN